MVDCDGLWLYPCFRGTNLTESMHQTLTTSFGHTRAGPRYSDNLLAMVRHVLNWRASKRNRPGFPRVGHMDGRLLDATNDLFEDVFGEVKYEHWVHSDESNTNSKSPYGLVTLDDDGPSGETVDPVAGLTKSLHYLALRQGSAVPFTPVKTKEEKKHFGKVVARVLREEMAWSAADTFKTMAGWWNDVAKETNKIYKKHPEHLSSHYKAWSKNQKIKEAVKAAKAKILLNAVEKTPSGLTTSDCHVPQPLGQHKASSSLPSSSSSSFSSSSSSPGQSAATAPQWSAAAIAAATAAAAAAATIAAADEPAAPTKKRAKKKCTLCKDPDCTGGYNKKNCKSVARIAGARTTRKVRNPSKQTCALCQEEECPGGRNRRLCRAVIVARDEGLVKASEIGESGGEL